MQHWHLIISFELETDMKQKTSRREKTNVIWKPVKEFNYFNCLNLHSSNRKAKYCACQRGCVVLSQLEGFFKILFIYFKKTYPM